MIISPIDIKEQILKGLYNAVGTNTPAQGIAFALPVNSVVGLSKAEMKEAKDSEKAE